MISLRVKQLRKKHNMTQTEFGVLFGVGKTTVSSWETNNSSPSDEIKIAICKRFNVSMDWLFGIEKIQPNNIKKGFEKMESSKSFSRYSDALKELFLPRLKNIVDKDEITIDDCDKACEMLNTIKKALLQEKNGVGLF